jgi:hypothetical protein
MNDGLADDDDGTTATELFQADREALSLPQSIATGPIDLNVGSGDSGHWEALLLHA